MMKKLAEKQRLQLVMKENEELRAKVREEEKQERENDIKLQQEYIRLQEEME